MLGRLQGLANTAVLKGNLLFTKSIFYGKVAAEVSKQIYVKEGLKPPSVNEFKTVYNNLYKQALQYSVNPMSVLNCVKNIKKPEAIKYGSYFVQFLGFYSLGQIIGRRKLIGYKNYSHEVAAGH